MRSLFSDHWQNPHIYPCKCVSLPNLVPADLSVSLCSNHAGFNWIPLFKPTLEHFEYWEAMSIHAAHFLTFLSFLGGPKSREVETLFCKTIFHLNNLTSICNWKKKGGEKVISRYFYDVLKIAVICQKWSKIWNFENGEKIACFSN